jgi:aromatic-L-amino-acid decarboxylase
LTAAVAARETALRYLATTETGSTLSGDGFDIPDDIRAKYSSKLVMYGSTHTHSLGQKVSQTKGVADPRLLLSLA